MSAARSATTSARVETPSLRSTEPTWRRTVTGATPSSSAISEVLAARRSRSTTSHSRAVSAIRPLPSRTTERRRSRVRSSSSRPRGRTCAARRAAAAHAPLHDVRQASRVEAVRQVAARPGAHRSHELLLVELVRQEDHGGGRYPRDDLVHHPQALTRRIETEEADVRMVAYRGVHRGFRVGGLGAACLRLERETKPYPSRQALGRDEHVRALGRSAAHGRASR